MGTAVKVSARLRWRLLVVPRVLLAAAVLARAVVRVGLTRRRPQPPRLPPTGADPVGAAIADARPVSRFPGEPLDAADLRGLVSVGEWEVEDGAAHNTVVGLDDEVASYADLAEDGLADALADQPGIDAVEHIDRETLLVRSALSLPDVHAAAVRALLGVNRSPRRTPRLRPLAPAVLAALADGVAGVLSRHGFDGPHWTEFRRSLDGEGLTQVVRLCDGVGHHNDDGTVVRAFVRVTVEVVEPAPTGEVPVLAVSYDRTPATVEGITRVLVSQVLPLCASTASRAAVVDRWVAGLPWHVPDRPRREAADIARRWGFPGHARDLR